MTRIALLLVGLTTLAAASPASAQTAPTVRETWVAGGFGAGTIAGTGGGVLGSLEVAHRWDEHLVMFATTAVFDLSNDSMADLGVLYGRVRSGGSFESSAAVGLAFVESGGCTSCPIAASTIGIPIRLASSYRPTPILGLGIRAVANLNTEASYVGFAFVIELGDLR